MRLDACVCCGAAGGTPVMSSLVKCGECGHVWYPDPITVEDLEHLYSSEYFSGREYVSYVDDRSQLETNFAQRLQDLKPFLDPARHRRLLEIGCAHGFFLNLARPAFSSVTGVDISADALQYAREHFGLDVRQSDRDMTLPAGTVDVVCLWDTIEHLRHPDRCIESIARHTEPGAIVALTTGDIGSLNARLRGAEWRLIHPPTHIHYFTRVSITRLLDRFGFDIVRYEHCGFSRSIGAMITAVLKGRAPKLMRLWERFGRPMASASLYLNLHDIMFVVARRRL